MRELEPIFTVIANEKDLQFFVENAEKHGITRGNRAAWKLLRKHIIESKQIPEQDFDEFTIHLRLLADHFLIFAQGERNATGFISQYRKLNDERVDALKHAKELRKRADWESIKNILTDGGTSLKAALKDTISTIEDEIRRQRIPTSSNTPTRRSEHALVQTFEVIWNLYARKPIKRNTKAYKIAGEFFRCAGYLPREGTSGELSDVPGKFKQSRRVTEHLGPLTTVRRLTPDEKRVLVDLVF